MFDLLVELLKLVIERQNYLAGQQAAFTQRLQKLEDGETKETEAEAITSEAIQSLLQQIDGTTPIG